MFFRAIRRAFAPQNLIVTTLVGLVVTGVAVAAIGSGNILNNSIRSIDIANGSLLSADIRDGSLFGRDLHTNSLTGRQISEYTLDTVPSATQATQANNADKLDDMDSTAFVSKSENKRVSLRLNAGDADVTVMEAGPLKVYARCTSGGGDDALTFYASTTTDNALMDGDEDTGDIDVATAETDREFNADTTVTDNPYTNTLYDFSAIIWSSDGKYSISMDEGSGGFFFNHFGKRCGFDGEFHAYTA